MYKQKDPRLIKQEVEIQPTWQDLNKEVIKVEVEIKQDLIKEVTKQEDKDNLKVKDSHKVKVKIKVINNRDNRVSRFWARPHFKAATHKLVETLDLQEVVKVDNKVDNNREANKMELKEVKVDHNKVDNNKEANSKEASSKEANNKVVSNKVDKVVKEDKDKEVKVDKEDKDKEARVLNLHLLVLSKLMATQLSCSLVIHLKVPMESLSFQLEKTSVWQEWWVSQLLIIQVHKQL